jgi:hypothetical protein
MADTAVAGGQSGGQRPMNGAKKEDWWAALIPKTDYTQFAILIAADKARRNGRMH